MTENKCMNQRNKRMTKRDNSTEIKQRVPDFSGKYHGKLNDKISRKSDVKISMKCNCRKKGHNR